MKPLLKLLIGKVQVLNHQDAQQEIPLWDTKFTKGHQEKPGFLFFSW
ncbi:MAG: hypothetical protein JNM42_06675 [Propionivibrio sp.]|nr:hypothetical protein [Propionivibrio sp.]MBL8414103.1 hypothetical protein [Propionivibrio sp.]